MMRMLFLAGLVLPFMLTGAVADQQSPKVLGMNLVTLEGPYRYNDGGALVVGYIVRQPNNGQPNTATPAAGEMVEFRPCGNAESVQVPFGQLNRGGNCSRPGGTWDSWVVADGQLKIVGSTAGSTPVSTFSPEWKALLGNGASSDVVRALSLPTASGEKNLGLIIKP